MKHITLLSFFYLLLVLNSAAQQNINSKAQPGTLDSTFGNNGIAITTYSEGYTRFIKEVIQNDGKILVLGFLNAGGWGDILIRYLPDGNIDSSFGENGRAIVGSNGQNDLKIQSDDKIVVVGGIYHITLFRFLTNGQPDSSFGTNGMTISNFGGFGDFATAVAIQPDDKIVITGNYAATQISGNSAFVARYNTDGSLDETFGETGKTIISSELSDVHSIALHKDGKIVIGGNNGLGNASAEQFFLACFNPDGQLDETFGNAGIVFTDFDNNGEFIQSIALQPDGKIIAAGAGNAFGNGLQSYMAVARYNTDGTLDETFVNNGKAKIIFSAPSQANSVALQQNGKIVIAGWSSNNDGNFAVARLLNNGVLDSSFAINGETILDLGALNEQYLSVAIQNDGKIVAGGEQAANLILARYYGDPVHQSLITRIKRWIRNHILHFQDMQPSKTAYYVIERSSNSTSNFKEIARVSSNNRIQDYSYADNTFSAGINYYRIKAVDNNGGVTYSDIISETDNNASASSFSIYPNPVKDVLHVSGLNATVNYELRIMNANSNVMRKTSVQNASVYNWNLNGLKAGVYYLNIQSKEKNETHRFVKE